MTRPLETGDPAAFRAPRLLDVLIPTRNRPAELATTLAGLAAQTAPPGFGVAISDQSDGEPSWAHPAAATMTRVLRHTGHPVLLTQHLPRRGLAEHRAFLLDRSAARYVLFLDDDVWLEPGALGRMTAALRTLRCGFVGNGLHGLSYKDDIRPDTHAEYQEWPGRPTPEDIRPHGPEWTRSRIHSAANLLHLTATLDLAPGEWRAYKVSWIGGCVLFDREKLLAAGGFDFWRKVPPNHQGEDVAAQLAVLRRFGGAGIVPSGAYHLEAPTTVTDRDVECWELLDFGATAPPPAENLQADAAARPRHA